MKRAWTAAKEINADVPLVVTKVQNKITQKKKKKKSESSAKNQTTIIVITSIQYILINSLESDKMSPPF